MFMQALSTDLIDKKMLLKQSCKNIKENKKIFTFVLKLLSIYKNVF